MQSRSNTPTVNEEDPIAKMQRSEYGKMIEDMQLNLNVIKGEIYKLIVDNKKKAISTGRKCLHNIRLIAFRMRQELMKHKKSMPIRKLTRKAKTNA